MNELELKQEFEAMVPEGYFEAYEKYEEAKVRMAMLEGMFKESADGFLSKHDLSEYKYGRYSISKTKDFVKKVVDTQKLKDEGLYEMFTKDSLVKGHINIKVNYEE